MMTLIFPLVMSLCFPSVLSLMISFLLFVWVAMVLLKHDLDVFCLSSSFVWDTLSHTLLVLNLWVIILMVFSSMKISNKHQFKTLYLRLMVLLAVVISLAFSVHDYIYFYILFEASLIPTFMLILGWGYQPERLQAGVYMLMYTVLASLPLLVSLLFLNYTLNSSSMMIVPAIISFTAMAKSWPVLLFMAFLVKLPLYFVHLWLPKAHVEAPVAGSMILAAILLKLGGYGIYRLVPKVKYIVQPMNYFFIAWALVGGVMVGLTCFMQTDVKSLIALSSVAHMALVLSGIMTFSDWGLNAAVYIMVGHGFCSSGLFCIANMNYERLSSRGFSIFKGQQLTLPALSLWWFLLCVANMAGPPSLNLLGEMQSILATFNWSSSLSVPLVFSVFLAALYSLSLYSMSQHGKGPAQLMVSSSDYVREHLVLFLHSFPLFVLVASYHAFTPKHMFW